jgi:hypothetical protein
MNIQEQLHQMQSLAFQHYPEDSNARLLYLNGLYAQRLRELSVMLEVRDAS